MNLEPLCSVFGSEKGGVSGRENFVSRSGRVVSALCSYRRYNCNCGCYCSWWFCAKF